MHRGQVQVSKCGARWAGGVITGKACRGPPLAPSRDQHGVEGRDTVSEIRGERERGVCIARVDLRTPPFIEFALLPQSELALVWSLV